MRIAELKKLGKSGMSKVKVTPLAALGYGKMTRAERERVVREEEARVEESCRA